MARLADDAFGWPPFGVIRLYRANAFTFKQMNEADRPLEDADLARRISATITQTPGSTIEMIFSTHRMVDATWPPAI